MPQYADIIEISAPSEAVNGSRVDITVKIKNLSSSTIGIMAVAFHSGQAAGEYINGLYPQEAWANVSPGSTYSFPGYFAMPNQKVTIHAYSYWWGADNAWHFDEEMTKDVNLAALTPQVSEFKIADYSKV